MHLLPVPRHSEVVGCVGGVANRPGRNWLNTIQHRHSGHISLRLTIERVGSFGGEQPHEGRPTELTDASPDLRRLSCRNRRRRKISTTMSAVAALGCRTPFSAIAVIEATRAQQAPRSTSLFRRGRDRPAERTDVGVAAGLSAIPGSACLRCRRGSARRGAARPGRSRSDDTVAGDAQRPVPGLTTRPACPRRASRRRALRRRASRRPD